MHPTVKAARTAGIIYLILVLVGPFTMLYVPNVLIATADPAATAAHIVADEMLLRFAILADVFTGALALALTFALYRLFKNVSRELSAALVILGGIVVAPIFLINALNWIAALMFAHGGPYFAAFSAPQQDALATFFLRLHNQGNLVDGVFSGLWLFPFGLLVIRSRFMPQWLGVWLLIDGAAWLAVTAIAILAPAYHDIAFTVCQPAFFGEIAVMLYLLIKGANVAPARAAFATE